MAKAKLEVLAILTLTSILSFVLPSDAAEFSTPLAWKSSNAPSVSDKEIQVYFGDQVYVPDSYINWSIDSLPTELGAKMVSMQHFIYYAMPPCSAKAFDGCIEGLQYRMNNGSWEEAVVSSRELPSKVGQSNPGARNSTGVLKMDYFIESGPDMAKHKPSAGRASYWTLKNAPHGGGNEYLLRANIAGPLAADGNGRVQRYLEMGLYPVNGLIEYQFPQDIEIKIRLKLGVIAKDLWGWFDGRVINPNVILDTSSGEGIVEIAGSPARIPIGATPKRNTSDFQATQLTGYTCDGRTEAICPTMKGFSIFSTGGNSDVENFPRFENLLGTVSTVAVSTAWWIKTTRWSTVATVAGCPANQSGFTGIVTTNATMYKTDAPVWDPKDATFNFQVASPHIDQQGQPNSGYYSLILPKSLAECRWGAGVANAKAVVSVLSENGTSQIATSTFRVLNDLLIFNISGFTYSMPKIKIGLVPTPKQEVAPSASPTATPKSSMTKTMKTIKCVKGKTIKKVTALAPKCPSGYKTSK